ncbi:DUF5996 family protein [Candidatus Kapabacteria bacterium]|nr:DUF5996 family protein [Candidatus Kapabacteria bacterium]
MKILDFNTENWSDAKGDVQQILQVMGSIKAYHSPKDKQWYHHSLVCTSQMISTDVFPVLIGKRMDAVEIEFDPIDCVIFLSTQNESEEIPIDGQSQKELFEQIRSIYSEFGVQLNTQIGKDFSSLEIEINQEMLAKYWRMLQFTDLLLKQFKSELIDEESSNVNLWPHHFDLAMLWFSGKLIKGADSDNKEMYQMNFGLSAGDKLIEEPYYYVTSNPFNDDILKQSLNKNASWNTKDWKGSILKYSDIVGVSDQKTAILDFWKTNLDLYKSIQNL